MFPTDFFITCEIKSINNDSYVIVVESVRKILSISVTDTEKFMYGEITFQEFNDISEKLQLASEKVIDCLG